MKPNSSMKAGGNPKSSGLFCQNLSLQVLPCWRRPGATDPGATDPAHGAAYHSGRVGRAVCAGRGWGGRRDSGGSEGLVAAAHGYRVGRNPQVAGVRVQTGFRGLG